MSRVFANKESQAATEAKAPLGGLRIGVPDDSFKHEADRAGTKVISEAKEKAHWSIANCSIASERSGCCSGGKPLDEQTRRQMQPRFRHDFGTVRVHTSGSASRATEAVGARAITMGRDIVFSPGFYVPSSDAGKRLIAHELTHVVQQDGQNNQLNARGSAEGEARHVSTAALTGHDVGIRSVVPVAPYADSMSEDEKKRREVESRLPSELLNSLRQSGIAPSVPEPSRKLTPIESFEPELAKGLLKLGIGTQAPTAKELPKINLPGPVKVPSVSRQDKSLEDIVARSVGVSTGLADTEVPFNQREALEPGPDYMADPAYIDNIVHAFYDLKINRFELEHSDGTSFDLEADKIRKVVRGGQKAPGGAGGGLFFRNTQTGKIYPVHFSLGTIPNIAACWEEIEKQTPESLENAKQAFIDVAIGAHGVAQATITAGRKIAEAATAGKRRLKTGPSDEKVAIGDAEKALAGDTSKSAVNALVQVFRKGDKVRTFGAVSLKRLRNILGRAGVSPRGYKLVKVPKDVAAAMEKEVGEPVWGFVNRSGGGTPAMDARGRPIINFTPRALASLEEAVKTFGHEVKHLKDFAAGLTTSSEALAEKEGEKLWLVIQEILER